MAETRVPPALARSKAGRRGSLQERSGSSAGVNPPVPLRLRVLAFSTGWCRRLPGLVPDSEAIGHSLTRLGPSVPLHSRLGSSDRPPPLVIAGVGPPRLPLPSMGPLATLRPIVPTGSLAPCSRRQLNGCRRPPDKRRPSCERQPSPRASDDQDRRPVAG